MAGPPVVRVGAGGAELRELAAGLPGRSVRTVLGIAGAPGAGKSTVATALAELLGARCAVVPLDGFHLADRELVRQGLLGSKGAPETFDAWGYAATLQRVRSRPPHPIYVPAFERDLEQPLAGAIEVPESVDVVLTEGNYLLLDTAAWEEARASMDAVWFVTTDSRLRRRRLVERHVRFGKTEVEAARWEARVDEPNAIRVQQGQPRADRVLDLTDWTGQI